MLDYLFVLTNSSGHFYSLYPIKLNVVPEIDEVFELTPSVYGKWKVVSYDGSIGEYGKLIYGVYVLRNIS
jgi:hypothetical protein